MPIKILDLKVKKLNNAAVIPKKSHDTDAGFDLFSIERVVIASQSRVSVATGLAFEIPPGHFMKIFDRSGRASSTTTVVLAGVVDQGYRGEVKIVLANYGDFPTTVEPNTAIAQFVVLPVPNINITEVTELTATPRGDAGFGSTDKKESTQKV
jgi:dUTP pyrophosphatase